MSWHNSSFILCKLCKTKSNTSHSNLKEHYVVFGVEIQTQNIYIYNIYEVMIWTQKYVFHNWTNKLVNKVPSPT